MIKLESTTPIKGRYILLAIFAVFFSMHFVVSQAVDAAFAASQTAPTIAPPEPGSVQAVAAQYELPVEDISILSQPHECQACQQVTKVYMSDGSLYRVGDKVIMLRDCGILMRLPTLPTSKGIQWLH